MGDATAMLPVFLAAPEFGIPMKILNLSRDLPISHFRSLLPFPTNSFYITFNGKVISSLSDLIPFSTITVRARLHGGGGDGGSTCAESRDCYLNMYAEKKPDKVDPNETRISKWTTCALSAEPLAPPCVIDRLGNIFNKEKLLQALLEKKIPNQFRHIKRTKDMISVTLEEINGSEGHETRFQCPITGLEFNGKYGFFAIKGCGHVVSTKSVKELKASTSACVVCNKKFTEADKIVINGSDEEIEALRGRMEEEKGRVRHKKEKINLSGVKSVGDGGVEKIRKKEIDAGGGSKRFKAVDNAPLNANKKVYASIFTSSKKTDLKETYMCRSLPLARN